MNGTFSPLWKKLMKRGREIEKASDNVANTMTADQIQTIKESIDYIVPQGVPEPMRFNAQFDFDLRGPPRYRLYDAIGMAMGGRWGEDADTLAWVDKLAKTYIGCVEDKKVKTRTELYDCVGKEVYD